MNHEPQIDRLAPPLRAARVLMFILIGSLVATALVLVFVPWVQTSQGFGRVVAYAPLDRQQNIDAPIEGRIIKWYVREGTRVKAGEPIVELSDNDPEILKRLEAERVAMVARLEAIRARAAALQSRITQLERSRKAAIGAAGGRATMSVERLRAAERALEAARAAERTAELNHDRQAALLQKGLTSARAVELAELERIRTRTEADRASAALDSARAERFAFETEQQRAGTDGFAAIDDARAARAAALAEEASTSAELARVEVRLARQSAQRIVAPRDGYILRVAPGHQGAVFKAGEVLAVLVPETDDRAIEMWIGGNDVPLIQEGRSVRLQFEGWPALQFSGWPSVAVGTFPGKVAVVDATDDGKGKFRVLVVPDGDWPAPTYLRQGVRAQGWILLNEVRLGFELWRQLNGFPPALPAPVADATASKAAESK